MKVLVVHNFYKQPGGEDQCVADELALLKARGHEVIPYSVHNDSIDGMGRLNLAARTIWSRTAYDAVRALIRAHRPQIAHFHNTFPLISPAAYYAARAEGVGVVQTLHNFRLLCPNALFFRNGRVCEECLGRSFSWPGIAHRCYRGSRIASAATAAMTAVHRRLGTWRDAVDVYIALTQFSRQKFIAGGLPPQKLVIKPNFVHPDPLSACALCSETTDGRRGQAEREYGIFVGRLSEEKGLQTLLAAWKKVRPLLPLKIVGDGPLATLVKEAAAEDPRIEWLGRKSLDQVLALIGEASFLIVPSHCYETFGRVVIEAFALGTPVIASNLGAMAELVEDGATGLRFEPGNPIDLATKIEHLVTASQQRAQMRQAARQAYERHYTAETNYRLLLAIYERILNGKPRIESESERGLITCGAT
ncbi:MAG TPA: glycosyltransferase family 4 protein [Gemmataceae bacterium]|nr:glycosyltransferase family 4 protein [Gemmataceae bacterium]